MNSNDLSIRRLLAVFLALFHIKLFAFTIESKTDGKITDLGRNESNTVSAGVPFDTNSNSPTLLQSAGRIPVLIIPLKAQRSVVHVESPPVADVLREASDLKVDESISEVTMYLSEIHRAMGARDFGLAKQKLDAVKQKHPHVRFFDFIEASLAFLGGDHVRALNLVNSGLKAHPTYSPGLELKTQLTKGKAP